jgi:hypothetical protein
MTESCSLLATLLPIIIGQDSAFELFNDNSGPFVLGALGIIAGVLYALCCAGMRHRERMSMIKRGMHPDLPETAQETPHRPVEKKPAKAAWNDYGPSE